MGVLVEVGEGMDVGVELGVDVAVSVGVRVVACKTAVPEGSEVATWDTVTTPVGVYASP